MKLQAGQKFGMLTVTEWDRQRKAWLCKCDCGGMTYARAHGLRSGKHTRCKCGKTAIRAISRLPDELGVKREIMRQYQKAAQRRGYEFSLTEEQFTLLLGQRCHYCNSEPIMILNYYKHAKERNFRHNGIDRVNNHLGYTADNSVSCCKICNNAKAELSVVEFMLWIRKIHTHLFNSEFITK
jgi:hypothetical protein